MSLLAALALPFMGCNRYEVEDGCLPTCDAEDEALFEECVAFGGGPDACRPGNRRCCALAAECLGDIGDQIVEATEVCGVDPIDVEECFPPCSFFPDAELFWTRCTSGMHPDECPGGAASCCAGFLGCLGEVGDVAFINGPPGCCEEDEDCAEDSYCDIGFHCRPSDCAGCGFPRACEEGECGCLDASGDFVVQCPDEEICGGEGRCTPTNPCDSYSCGDGEVCLPQPDPGSGALFEAACFVLCDETPDVCGAGEACDGFICYEIVGGCSRDEECGAGEWCDSFGFCSPCDPPGTPDGCEVGNNDCDMEIDEDCDMGSCGNGRLEPPEDCDGDALSGTICSDLPGFDSGYLFCDGGCAFDTSLCSTEICDNGIDDDLMGGVDCDDPACFSDAAAGCCEPTLEPEICDGYDDDCDFVVDEDCTPLPEDCFNGFDDDGDGADDCDDTDCTPLIGTTCGSDEGECTAGTVACSSDGSTLECAGETPPAFESCNGLDDDCNGMVDDGVEPLIECRGGDYCSSGAFCDSAGSCVSSADGPCDDFNECTMDTCDALTLCANTPLAVGSPCAGGDGMCLSGGVCSL